MQPTYAPGPRGSWATGSLDEFCRDKLGFLRAAAAYGDIVHFRLGPSHVHLLAHPDLVRDVLVERAPLFERSRATKEIFGRTLGRGLLVTDGEEHRCQRRLAQPAFQPDRILRFAPVVVDCARDAASSWQEGGALDLAEQMTRITLRVVARALFGLDVAREAHDVGVAMATLQDTMSALFDATWIPPAWAPTPVQLRLRRAVRAVDELVMARILERRASDDGDDLLARMLRARDEDGSAMTDRQLLDQARTLFLAGFETTANALAWTWHLLGQHPEVESRLVAELEDVLGDRDPEASDLRQLRYTEMVVRESMRAFPPIWAFNRAPIEDVVIGGHLVRKGQMILVSPWVSHHDARYFPEPDAFVPERFAPPSAIPRYAYLPFGAGPHVCIGAQLAMLEAVLVVATVARRWQFTAQRGASVVPEALVSVRPSPGVRVVAHARDRAAISGTRPVLVALPA